MKTDLPTRIKLLDWGENPSDRGVFTVDETTAQMLRKQLEEGTYERLVIDFDHQSEPGSKTFEKSPRHHAGYGILEVVEGDGIYLANVEWTPAGEEFAPDYRDLSPALLVDDKKRVVGITSVAIVTNGGLQDGHTLLKAVRLVGGVPDPGTEADKAGASEPLAAEKPQPDGGTPADDPPPADKPDEEKPDAEKPDAIAALSGRIDGIESAMSERSAALGAAMADFSQRLDALGARLDELAAAAKPAEPAPNPEPLAARAPATSSGPCDRADEAVLLAAEKARLDTEAAEKDAARERAHLVQMAVAAGKAVTLPEAVLSRMTPDETRAYLATLPAKLPTGSAVRAAGPERPSAAPGREREDARSLLVADVRREHPDYDFNRAWTEARRVRPDLFRNGGPA